MTRATLTLAAILVLPGMLAAQQMAFVVDPAWLPERIEQRREGVAGSAYWDVIHFSNGKRLVTRMFDIEILGQLPRAGRPPFLLVGGFECNACDVQRAVFAVPSEVDSLTALPPSYTYPGTLSFGEAEEGPSHKGRLFVGRCLAGDAPQAVWFQSDRDSTGKWQESVFELAPTTDSLLGRFLTPKPQLRATLARISIGACFEVRGIENWGG